MLKVDMNRKEHKENVVSQGNLEEITTDIAHLINGFYVGLKQSSPAAAEMFRKCLTIMATEDDSVLWKPTNNLTVVSFGGNGGMKS